MRFQPERDRCRKKIVKQRRKIKKVWYFLITAVVALAVALALTGCGNNSQSADTTDGAIGGQANAAGNGSTAAVVQVHTKGVKPKNGGASTNTGGSTTVVTGADNSDVDISGIDPNKPMIAFTFDDGPGAGTERILKTFQDNGAKATFFELGSNIEEYPEMTKKLAEAGMQLCSHTYSHEDLTTLSDAQIAKEYAKTEAAMESAAGLKPSALRSPYGSQDEHVQSQTPYPIILWSVDTLDWSSRDATAICSAVYEADPQDGDILLFHDIYDSTAEAIETLVPHFKEKGYQMVTVAQMFAVKQQKLENGSIYCNA